MFALGTFARGEGEAFAGLVVDERVHDLGPGHDDPRAVP